jgi:hypothetical protein
MKLFTLSALIFLSLLLLSSTAGITYDVSAQDTKKPAEIIKPPEIIMLAKEAKLGPVTFSQ